MPLATSGIYEARLRTVRAGQDLFNVFYFYSSDGLNDNANELANLLIANYRLPVQDVLSVAVSLEDFTVTPVFGSGLEVIQAYPANTLGTQVGTSSPTFLVAPIRLNRPNKVLRSGWKRMGPMAETAYDGDFFTANVMIVLQACADLFATPLNGASTTYTPVIFRRPNTAINDPAARYEEIPSATAINAVRTQDSRRFGT